MKHKLLLTLVLYLVLGMAAWAQTRSISGRVTAAGDGSGLPGVTVLERGTTNGTNTDSNGNFTISVQEGANLVFSSIGFTTQTVPVAGQTNLNVKLQTSETLLGETVVVGYGSQAKRELTGSVTQLGSKEVENVPTVSFEQAIQGRTPGVTINQGSGKLGQGVTIRVRGASSVTASSQPLYVIDGVVVTSQDVGLSSDEDLNPLADLNPNDIESISILKDASASAIYGSRASNGVVIITTKKGRQGESRVNVGFYTGTSKATRIRKFLNRDQYKELFRESIFNALADSLSILRYDYGYPEDSNPDDVASDFGLDFSSDLDTKWNELAYRKGKVTQYDANVSGGDAKTRFYLSANYNDQTGIIIGNRYRRGSFRTNFDHSVSDRLKVGLNLSLVRSVNDRVPDDVAFTNPVQMNALPPLQSPYDGTDPTGYNRGTLYENALVAVNTSTNRSGSYRSIGMATLSYQPIKDLMLRAELGGDFLSLREELYYSRFSNDGAPDGYGYSNQVQAVNYTSNNTATWLKTIGDNHSFEVLGGFTFQRFDQNQTAVEGRGFPSDQFRRLASAARFTVGSGSSNTGYSFFSLLSRVNYAFRNRYLLSASIRGDKSSRFGKDKQWGTFPAASAGWVITEEDFLSNNSFVNLLKLRGSYGVTGNAEIGNFNSRTLYNGSQYGSNPGTIPSTILGNNLLTWENTAQADLGLEFGILKNRISGEIDIYQKNTTDLLLDDQLRFTGGYQTSTRNLGKLRNRGVEFALNTLNFDGEFKWTTNFNITVNRNKITDLNGQVLTTGSRNLSNVREGEPIGVFWGIDYAGVNPANGDALYYTADGNITNVSSDAERRKLGDPNPKFTGGLSNTFTFKGFEVSLLNQFSYGNDVYNTAGFYQSVNADYFDNQTVDQMNRWQKPGDITKVPQPRFLEGNGGRPSSRWIQDGSFLRFKNLQVAYNVPKEWAGKAHMANARIYVTGQNLWTITNYEGYDPEVNSTFDGLPNYLLGHDFYTPPLAKTWIVGVNIGF